MQLTNASRPHGGLAKICVDSLSSITKKLALAPGETEPYYRKRDAFASRYKDDNIKEGFSYPKTMKAPCDGGVLNPEITDFMSLNLSDRNRARKFKACLISAAGYTNRTRPTITYRMYKNNDDILCYKHSDCLSINPLTFLPSPYSPSHPP